jgi:hypothetical protein
MGYHVTGLLVPGAALRPHPLQHVKVAARRSHVARPLAPDAAVRPQPLQHLPRPAASAAGGQSRADRGALTHRQMPAVRGRRARGRAPRARVAALVLRAHPPQHVQVPALRRRHEQRRVDQSQLIRVGQSGSEWARERVSQPEGCGAARTSIAGALSEGCRGAWARVTMGRFDALSTGRCVILDCHDRHP